MTDGRTYMTGSTELHSPRCRIICLRTGVLRVKVYRQLKCFVNALSMMVVGVVHASTSTGLHPPLLIGVTTSIAIDQYTLS